MNHLAPLRISTRSAGNLVGRSPSRHSIFVAILVLGLFALSPTARAVDPPSEILRFTRLEIRHSSLLSPAKTRAALATPSPLITSS